MNEFMLCPLCGKPIKRLKKHLRMAKEHRDLDVDQWLLDNPDVPTLSEGEYQRQSEIRSAYSSTPRGKAHMSRMAKIAWETESSRQSLLESRRKQHETLEFKELHSKVAHKTMIKLMADPDFYESAMKNIQSRGRRFDFVTLEGDVIKLRSELELGIATYLKEHNLSFRYEKDPVKYVGSDGEIHSYYIDFYIPSLGLAIEGKPKQLWDREGTQIKLQSAKKHFPKVLLVAYDLTELDSIIGSVTTTESISKEKDLRE